MFGKKNSSDNKRENSGNRSSAGSVDGHNIIVSTTKLKGDVTASNDFRIDGEFIGSLQCSAKVIIGSEGRFKGDVTCENAVIEGRFEGQLNVNEVLYVKESAVIHGEVVTGKLIVQSGSIFEVNCKMTGSDNPDILIDNDLAKEEVTVK